MERVRKNSDDLSLEKMRSSKSSYIASVCMLLMTMSKVAMNWFVEKVALARSLHPRLNSPCYTMTLDH